jgi:predicted dehydrogenase
MSSSSVGVAVIGAGMAGRAHAAGYRMASTVYGGGLPPIRLVAISDIKPQFADETARRYGYERAETNWQAVAAAADIDVVSVVVANDLHREIVEGLIAAGKHVLCEKPLAPTIADAEAMVKAAHSTDRHVVLGFTFRRSPAIDAIRNLIQHDGTGRPLFFSGHYWCDYALDPKAPMSWRYTGGPGSGALADIGSHLVDTAEFVCGPITSVQGATMATAITSRARPAGDVVGHAAAELSDIRESVENEDVVAFAVTFASGAVGTLSASRIACGLPNALGFEVFAEAGAATFDLARPGEFHVVDTTVPPGLSGYRQVLVGPDHPYLAGGLAMDFPGVNYGQNDLFVFQARAFLEQVCGVAGLPPCASFDEGLHNMRVLDAVVRSYHSNGQRADVPF